LNNMLLRVEFSFSFDLFSESLKCTSRAIEG
jgi:hypothetical protein